MARDVRAIWAKRVERWIDSGLTAHEFATEVGVNANTLSHWKWRLSKEARSGSRAKKPQKRQPAREVTTGETTHVDFIEVAAPLLQAESRFELELQGGRRLFVPPHFDPDALVKLIDILDARQ